MHRLRMIEAEGDCLVRLKEGHTHTAEDTHCSSDFGSGSESGFDFACEIVIVSPDTLTHIGALRLRDGEEVEIINFERGMLYRASYVSDVERSAWGISSGLIQSKATRTNKKTLNTNANRRSTKVARQAHFIVSDEEALLPDLPVIHLFHAKSKQAKHEFVAQKAVEAGVHEIVIFESDFSEKGAELKISRLEKIAAEAALQSKSPVLPSIRLCSRIETFDFSGYDKVLFFYEHGEEYECIHAEELKSFSDSPKIAVIIGSEGGFSEKEAEWAKKNFGSTYSLGNRILRTETAALAAVAIVKYECGKYCSIKLHEFQQNIRRFFQS